MTQPRVYEPEFKRPCTPSKNALRLAERLLFRPWCTFEGPLVDMVQAVASQYSEGYLQRIEEETRKDHNQPFTLRVKTVTSG